MQSKKKLLSIIKAMEGVLNSLTEYIKLGVYIAKCKKAVA